MSASWQGLTELGKVEHQNAAIELRWAQVNPIVFRRLRLIPSAEARLIDAENPFCTPRIVLRFKAKRVPCAPDYRCLDIVMAGIRPGATFPAAACWRIGTGPTKESHDA